MRKIIFIILAILLIFAFYKTFANAGGIAGPGIPLDDIVVDDVVIIEEIPVDTEFTEEWVLRQALKGGIDVNTGSVTLQVDTMEDAWRIKELFDNYYIGNYRVEWGDKRIYLYDPALFITWRE